jgi:broad specificity phosphatase PhoE
VRLFVLTRHAQSTLNVEQRVNGDPAVPAPLTAAGEAQARLLGAQLEGIALDLCVHTRFDRTRRTAELALEGRAVPRSSEPLLDDVDVGELDGVSFDAYRGWKREHRRDEAFPGGESLDDAALRYVRGFRALLGRPEQTMLVVCHEIPIRYALNAAAGADDLDGPVHAIPNAVPYLFDAVTLERAADGIERITRTG